MLSTDDVLAVAQGIAQSMLSGEFEQRPQADGLNRADHLTGCVQITGQWTGAVVVDCSGGFARLVSRRFLNDDDATTADDLRDSVAELANMIGGNVKSLLPGPSYLSLPSVAVGREHAFHVPGARLVCEVPLELNGCPLAIAVLEEEERSA